MANQSVIISVSKFGYVDESTPSTHYSVSDNTAYNLDAYAGERSRFFLGGFSAFPSSIRYNVLNGIEIILCARKAYATSSGSTYIRAYAAASDFDANSLTWNNQPAYSNSIGIVQWGTISDTNWHDVTANPYSSSSGEVVGRAARDAMRGGSIYLIMTGSGKNGDDVRKNLLAGGNAYIRVWYNDSVTATPTGNVTTQPSATATSQATIDPRTATAFAWNIITSESSPCVGVYTASSSVFKWKAAGESNWHTVNLGAGVTSYTVPANTFPTGKTITWDVDITLDTGSVISAYNAHTFKTLSSQITPSSYPSGTSVDNRSAKYFSWYFTNGFTQQSATLYWKTGTESGYIHNITVSDSTTNLTVPGYTFPSGATISWYLRGVDTAGNVSESIVMSFTCLAGNITPSSFPTGSNVNTGEALTFNWTLTNSLGEIQQDYARLYWKKSTEGSYHSIYVSGNLKRCIVPANTFPTSATIQWYIVATDPGANTYTSTEKSFNSVAPTVTAENYPSGNNVNYGADILFKWKLSSNGQGDYTQTSAKLYWRKDTLDNWTQISISGNVKQLTVPAYTFPPDKTIYWYLEATDFGGATTSTGQKTFKTAKSVITPQDSPTSGYADPRSAITFKWYFTDGENTYVQQNATFKWREAGEENWNTISASGTTQSVTVPANTFPILSNIEWMLSGTDAGGATSETSVFTFSTTASTAYAVCGYPIGRVIDGSKDIVFTWTVRNSDGSQPTRIVLEWKKSTEAASAWRTLVDSSDPIMSYTAEANTFPAGPIDWRVTAYNRDSVAGPASAASFVCVAAPDTPIGLTATAVPRTMIRWQPTGQKAYEIQIDGTIIRSAYGPEVTSWQVMEPLPDGLHTVRVRIQGEYGLWSSWAETTISVSNAPKGTVSLKGKFRVDAELKWTHTGNAVPEIIAIYRDGKWIGQATGKLTYTDRFVLGEHGYRVEYWYADGNYDRSNEASGCMASEILRIAPYEGGEWMALKYSDSGDRKQGFSWSQESAMHQVSGSLWPVLETAPYETLTGSYDCAFTEEACIRKFEQMRGRIVILKSKGGNVVIGGLTATQKTVGLFYTVFSFSVRQCHWEDFVNDDAND